MFKISYFLLCLMHLGLQASSQEDTGECGNNILGVAETFYVLSDARVDADFADGTCKSSGGTLIQSQRDETKQKLIQFMIKKYAKDLETITVHQNPSTPFFAKYRTSSSKDTKDLSQWDIPAVGQLRSFKASKTELAKKFEHKSCFSFRTDYAQDRDDFYLNDSTCDDLSKKRTRADHEWKLNFQVFISKAENESFRKLVRRRVSENVGSLGTRIFLDEDLIPSKWSENVRSSNELFYIPGLKVFVGVRSDFDQSRWFWSNSTLIGNNFGNVKPNRSYCQQMAWPLTYDDGVNLTAINCSQKAHFACQYKFIPSVKSMDCNASTLEISWNMFNISSVLPEASDFQVEILVKNTNYMKTMHVCEAPATVTGLKKRTSYSLKIALKSSLCENAIVTKSLNATTGYGLPDPVKEAQVLNDTSPNGQCVIEWEYDPSDGHVHSYEITETENSSFTHTVQAIALDKSTTRGKAETKLSSSEVNTTVKFKIQALSCEGKSEPIDITGSCYRPLSLPASGLSAAVWAGIGVFALIVILVAIALLVKQNRIPRNELKTSEETEANTQIDITVDCPGYETVKPHLENEYEEISTSIGKENFSFNTAGLYENTTAIK